MQPFTHVVIHYDEIALKSSKRADFERLLRGNIEAKIGSATGRCMRESGQLTLILSPDADREAVVDALQRMPGVVFFSPAWQVTNDMSHFADTGVALLRKVDFHTFKVATKRHNKENAWRSMEINREVGAAVLEALPEKKVRMAGPDATLKIELMTDHSYLSVEQIEGVGGLPTDGKQRVTVLLSGGLDSPVAAYLMMKRGCRVELVHFQNRNQMTASVEDKIVALAEQLSRYQRRTYLHIVPFDALQREIIKHVKPRLRMLLYRRVMLQMAGDVAGQCRARFLATGDCLSQVASQTYENLSATYMSVPLPVLTPLIGLDKKEIVAIARRIGTFDISSLPYEDCCTFFVPRHPELRATPDILDHAASAMELNTLIEEAHAATRTLKW